MARRSSEAVAAARVDFTAAIAERAYFKALDRGFAPGHELEDWLAAERELSALMSGARMPTAKKPAVRRKTAKAAKTKKPK